MKFTSHMQLRDWIKNKSKKMNAPEGMLMRAYFMERFLERVSISEYKENIVIKGGFLISSLVGIDVRMTMDLDTTVKSIEINRQTVEEMINKITTIDVSDGVTFEILSIKPIRDISEYDDFRISIRAWFLKLRQDIKIDITVGDHIIPEEIEYDYKLMFEERTVPIMAYSLYTILAEKLDAILTRNTESTRARDYYDIHLLVLLNKDKIDRKLLQETTRTKMENRHHAEYFDNCKEYLKRIENSPELRRVWNAYTGRYSYAKDIEFTDIIPLIYWLLERE